MSDIGTIPLCFGPEFLAWLQTATERAWASIQERTFEDYRRARVGGASWRRGTRWTGGLSESEITAIEQRYGLCFPTDYCLFLRILHATTPRLRAAYFADDGPMRAVERPSFFDWQHDDAEIRAALAWPLEGLLFDVESNRLWSASWGRRPETAEARRAHLEVLLAHAPKLVPIVGHRYIVPTEPHVVLSLYQSDIVVYGNDMRAFLLSEFASLLHLPRDPTWTNANVSTTPFWGELVG